MKNYIFILGHKILFLLLTTGITAFAQAQTAPVTWTTETTYSGTMPRVLFGVVVNGASYEGVCSALFSQANADPKNAVLTLETTNPCSIYWTYPVNNPPGYRNYKSTSVGISMQCAGVNTPYSGTGSATPAISVSQGRTCEFQCKSDLDERYQSTNWCVPKVCPVPQLTALTGDALAFENGNNIREDRLSPAMVGALNNLRDAVRRAGGALNVTSAWRPPEYQAHLREILDKRNILNNPDHMRTYSQCAILRSVVNAESGRHGIGTEVGLRSRHTTGDAFDAIWSGVTETTLDRLATEAGLSRPINNDPVHFQAR
jgi:uncharacterized protein YcbK (DUF882 family)